MIEAAKMTEPTIPNPPALSEERLREIAEIIDPQAFRPINSEHLTVLSDSWRPHAQGHALTKARTILSLLLSDKAALEAERDKFRHACFDWESGPSITVGGGLSVHGSMEAIGRVQDYILLDSTHPVEREDVRRSLARGLQAAEARATALEAERDEALDALQAALTSDTAYARMVSAEAEAAAWKADAAVAHLRVLELVGALEGAARTFRRYEVMHREKRTVEGEQKAVSNGVLATRCEAALKAVSPGIEGYQGEEV